MGQTNDYLIHSDSQLAISYNDKVGVALVGGGSCRCALYCLCIRQGWAVSTKGCLQLSW